MSTGPFYGKYRGTVINNVDPMLLGRIQAMVPDVAGLLPSSWAMPCVPVAGINMGMFTVPPVGPGVSLTTIPFFSVVCSVMPARPGGTALASAGVSAALPQ